MGIANHEHVSTEHRAVDRRATDHLTVDLRLVQRPRVRHIVRDAHPRLLERLPERLHERLPERLPERLAESLAESLPERLREHLRNANLGYRKRRLRDRLYRPVLNDKENNDVIRRLC